MTFHEDYARTKANEAIKYGLGSQKIHRTLSENGDSKPHRTKTQTSPFYVFLIKRIVQLTVSFLNRF